MTVSDFIAILKAYPGDWPVIVATPAGGEIAIEHREIRGKPVIAVFGSNGGRFGENPLTEEEYQRQSKRFMDALKIGDLYTSIHGDHRTYSPSLGSQATCYGQHYDRRIIERMVDEGLLRPEQVDLERVRHIEGERR